MSQVTFPTFTVGDKRPIEMVLTPSDNQPITSVAYTLNLRQGTANPVSTGLATCTNNGTDGWDVKTPLITFDKVGTYVCNFAVTYADGVVDNDVSAVIVVQALAS